MALLRNGDRIRIDANARLIHAQLDDSEFDRRSRDWKRRETRDLPPALAKYAGLVGPANKGAVTF